jgi:hypothetical protein
MHAPRKLWTDAWQVGLDARQVIAMRLVRISAGGATADAECRRMVSEKVSAAVAAQAAAAAALVSGEDPGRAALTPVKRAVRANHRRLSRAKRIDSVVSNMRRLFRSGSR